MTRVIFLGGVGEIGRNMFAVESDGRILVIDCGLSFPSEEMLGIDLVLPDFRYVADRARDCEAVVLTHGHEDHVGGLAWFLREVDVPVLGTALTLGLARRRLDEWGVDAVRFEEIRAGDRKVLGPFDCRFYAMSHSIPDAVSVVVGTTGGTIFYTSDFKLDEAPIDGRRTDVAGLGAEAEAGIDLMLADSTNAETPGRTPSESIVGDALRDIFAGASRRIVVACFASNLHRVQQVCEAAEAVGRRVAFVGRSMVANVEVGRQLGHLRVRNDTVIEADDVNAHPPEGTVVVCTGAQGEPLSALSLIAAGEHKWLNVEPGDTVVLSASPIPGNESAVHRVINALYRAGADVFHPGRATVHVSGHAASDELADLIRLMRPRHFVPVHGEYRHLALHADLARSLGVERVALVEDGDVLELDAGRVSRGEPVEAGTILVDGLGVGDVGPMVLRDRRILSQDGVLICMVTIDGRTGEVLAGPDLISRGFIHEEESRAVLDEGADRVADALAALEAEHVTDWGAIKKAARRALGEYVWTTTRRRPMILPLIMEV